MPFHFKASDLPGAQFPSDKHGRKFIDSWYYRRLDDGSMEVRDWLVYSKTRNKVYCLLCKLFGGSGAELPSRAWVQDGFSSWTNGTQRISDHECSPAHLLSSLRYRVKKSTLPLIPSLEAKRKAQVRENRDVVKQILLIIFFLATHCLALRGHREDLHDSNLFNRGYFIDLVLLVASFSPQLSNYVLRMQNKRKSDISFLSWRRQNQLISCIAGNIRGKIIQNLKSSTYFSILVDSSFDVSKHERVSFVVRLANTSTGLIEERLIAVRQVSSTTGEALFHLFRTICEECGLDYKLFLVGQSYDGASNMRGEYKGMQARIREEKPYAVYIWCWAHRLALIIVQSVSSCVLARDLFGNVERLFSFLTDGKKRVALYEAHQNDFYPGKRLRRLKKVESTRWLSHSYALNTVLDTFMAVSSTLADIADTSDGAAAAEASGLLSYICSERFTIPAFVCQKIFEILSPFTKVLQSADFDLLQALAVLQTSMMSISALRDESKLISIIAEARQFANEIEEDQTSNFEIEPFPVHRVRRVRQLQCESQDEPVVGTMEKIRVEFYYVVLDCISTQLKERFCGESREIPTSQSKMSRKGKGKGKGKSGRASASQSVTNIETETELAEDTWNLLSDIAWLSHSRLQQVKENPSSMPPTTFSTICNLYCNFLDADLVRTQYLQFAQHSGSFKDSAPMQLAKTEKLGGLAELFYMFHISGLGRVFPDLFSLIRIAVTLPVTSVTVERDFSKLKLILTRLRSTMSEERFEELMIIACERDVPYDIEAIIDSFASMSTNLQRELL